ncbi:MAG: efflux RND transporter periplasmic adaptor subunit [Halieaceae bacterium]
MKTNLLAATAFTFLSSQSLAQMEEQFGDELLAGLQTNVVRAQLVPLQKAVFSAGISAIVEQIHIQEGDVVERDTLLLSFDCDGIQAGKAMAQARVKSADATLQVNRELLKLNSVGPLEIQLNEAELDIANGELAAVDAQLKHCQVRAPFAGAVTQRAVDAYQFVAEGEPLLELVSRDRLEVQLLMPSTSLAWLRVGSDFSMLVEELNTAMPGKIVRIGGAVDPVSLTVPVFGKLDQRDDSLLPGMSGRVQFVTAEFD